MENKNIHTIVFGRVQGVGFRYFVQQAATRYNILGWVRNRQEGSVEIEAEGLTDNLNTFLMLVSQGPTASHVDKLKTEWGSATGNFKKFKIKRTFL